MANSQDRVGSAIVVRHGSGLPAELLEALRRDYAEERRRVEVLTAEAVAEGAELEAFMNAVTADDEVSVIHMVLPKNGAQHQESTHLSIDVSESIVRAVETVERRLERDFPALQDRDSWVVLDLGRAWTQSAREVTQELLEIAAECRIRAVFAVAGSTTGSVAGTAEDRAGMVADAVWSLATSDFGSVSGLAGAERPGSWLLGSRSFTLNGNLSVALAAAVGVRDAIDGGPLRPSSEAMHDQASDAAKQWVALRGIGSEEERKTMAGGASGAGAEKLSVDQSAVLDKAAHHWGPATEVEYLKISGEPLRRYTRLVEGNAEALFEGRPGDEQSGHAGSFDAALRMQVSGPGGCMRGGRFVNAVNEELVGLRETAASRDLRAPAELAEKKARSALDGATMTLSGVRPWLVRSLFAVMLTAILLKDEERWWLVAGVPVLLAAVLWFWLNGRRRRAAGLRAAYVAAVEGRVQSVAEQRLLTEQVEMMKRLQSHIGGYYDEHDNLVPMESALPPHEDTRAEDVVRIWGTMQNLRHRFANPVELFEDALIIESCGQFFITHPDAIDERQTLSERRSPAAQAVVDSVRQAASHELQKTGLDGDFGTLYQRMRELCDTAQNEPSSLQSLADLSQDLAPLAMPTLRLKNAPRLPAGLDALSRSVLIADGGSVPEGFEDLRQTADVVADSADRRRITEIWILSQDFAKTGPPPLEFESPRKNADIRPEGSAASGLAEGGGV